MTAKDILVKPITSASASVVVKSHHYSAKALSNSQLHLGVFWDGGLEGVMSFGPPMDRRRMLHLVRGTPWEGMIELNRMAFSPRLPRNSESRALGVAMRMIKSKAPQIQWVLSFADGTRCGDGTIYRAAGFWLTQIRANTTMLVTPKGFIFTDLAFKVSPGVRSRVQKEVGPAKSPTDAIRLGCKTLDGAMLRYIYPLRHDVKERLTVPILPYSEIARAGVAMYRGRAPEAKSVVVPDNQSGEGGADPTPALHDSSPEV
jgi:hypothetical protein